MHAAAEPEELNSKTARRAAGKKRKKISLSLEYYVQTSDICLYAVILKIYDLIFSTAKRPYRRRKDTKTSGEAEGENMAVSPGKK